MNDVQPTIYTELGCLLEELRAHQVKEFLFDTVLTRYQHLALSLLNKRFSLTPYFLR
jgi:hypothetical protein